MPLNSEPLPCAPPHWGRVPGKDPPPPGSSTAPRLGLDRAEGGLLPLEGQNWRPQLPSRPKEMAEIRHFLTVFGRMEGLGRRKQGVLVCACAGAQVCALWEARAKSFQPFQSRRNPSFLSFQRRPSVEGLPLPIGGRGGSCPPYRRRQLGRGAGPFDEQRANLLGLEANRENVSCSSYESSDRIGRIGRIAYRRSLQSRDQGFIRHDFSSSP